MGLGLKIRELRRMRGLTQAQLAKRLGVEQPALSRLEQPTNEMYSVRTLRRIADALDAQLVIRFEVRDGALPMAPTNDHSQSSRLLVRLQARGSQFARFLVRGLGFRPVGLDRTGRVDGNGDAGNG